ncbi:MAG: GntR family transcriptional regulator [Ruminococcaceae bacterium]|nr:GntR family transcriptional regulator [Oscillospiraceae bacterium]
MDKSFSLSHQVFKIMEQAIITEEIPSGTELTELGLSAKYGVSRTPIREAVAMLEQEDLVESTGKKIVVLGFSKQDIIDIVNVRVAIEGRAMALAARNITQEGIKELEDIIKMQQFYISENDSEKISQMDSEFHYTIYKHCGSRVYGKTLTELHRKMARYRALSVASKPRAVKSGEEHLRILEAIKAHNEALAEALGTEHANKAKQRLLED